MKAMIPPVAGGTRLRPLTDAAPEVGYRLRPHKQPGQHAMPVKLRAIPPDGMKIRSEVRKEEAFPRHSEVAQDSEEDLLPEFKPSPAPGNSPRGGRTWVR
jgi:hypothetical protein